MIGDLIKIEICKEVLKKSGMENRKDVIDSIFNAVMNDRFLFELNNNQVIKFVTWYPQIIDGKNVLFVNNLWIDPKHRCKDSLWEIRTNLRSISKNIRGIWFNRKKQKMIDRR